MSGSLPATVTPALNHIDEGGVENNNGEPYHNQDVSCKAGSPLLAWVNGLSKVSSMMWTVSYRTVLHEPYCHDAGDPGREEASSDGAVDA